MQLSDESLGNIRVGGYFRAGDTDALLLALEQSFGIESRVAAENILILEQNSPTVE
jgi:ferric-dicitrate binding protein FerR (iron transport regulator)